MHQPYGNPPAQARTMNAKAKGSRHAHRSKRILVEAAAATEL